MAARLVRNQPDGGLLTIGQYDFSSPELFPLSPASDALIRLRTRGLPGPVGPLYGDPPELEAISGTVDIDQTTSPLSAELFAIATPISRGARPAAASGTGRPPSGRSGETRLRGPPNRP